MTARTGENSYEIELKPGFRVGAHRNFFKPYIKDPTTEDHTPLFFHKRTTQDPDATPEEWEVEKILDHKISENGQKFFLTKWQGWEGTTWEPIGNFFHRYNAELVDYCQKHKLCPELVQDLSPTAHT